MKRRQARGNSRETRHGRWPHVPEVQRVTRGFTLLEVMIAVAFIGIALLALLTLHNRNLHSVIGAQEMSRATVLAQAVMAQAETGRYPDLGSTSGDFQRDYPGKYPSYRWQRNVAATAGMQDLRTVTVRIFYGSTGKRIFELDEIMHNPTPNPPPGAASGAPQNGAGD
jgi:general secretion pathway protein I